MTARLFTSLVALFIGFNLSAQEKDKLFHTMADGETLYMLTFIYEVPIDSILEWNNLASSTVKTGDKIQIKNLKNLNESQIELNVLNYELDFLAIQKAEILKSLKKELDILDSKKAAVDSNDPMGMQEIFSLSKLKKIKEDSANVYLNIIEDSIINKSQDKSNLVKQIKIDQAKAQKELDIIEKSETEEPKVEIEEPVKEDEKKAKKTDKEKIATEIPEGAEEKKEKTEKQILKELVANEPKVEKVKDLPKKSKSKNQDRDEEIFDEDQEKLDVLKFDVSFETDKDTLNRKDLKKKEKLEKELTADFDSTKAVRNIMVDEVEISQSKTKKKFKIGDEVDEMRQEKSKFYLSRAKLEIDKSNYKKANEFIDKCISLNPSNTDAYMLKGDIYASFEYYDKAIEQYQKATFLNNKIPQLYYNMGNCLIFLDRKDKAISMMTKAIEIDPTYVLAYSGRSSLYMDKGQYNSALKDYNTLLQINKYFYPALKGRGISYLNLGDYDAAIRDFNALLEYDEKDPSIYYHRGMAKMYKSELYGACIDFLSASEMGYSEGDKAISKYCD
ncbi:MAG: tetratricopeptide repeat protein [Chitinophagales bacterium]|nr:tetratricopeptide repeat protein [Chitinophagales bacterium]